MKAWFLPLLVCSGVWAACTPAQYNQNTSLVATLPSHPTITGYAVTQKLADVQLAFTRNQKCTTHFTRCGFCVQQPPCVFCEVANSTKRRCIDPTYATNFDDILVGKVLQLAHKVTENGFQEFGALAVSSDLPASQDNPTQSSIIADFVANTVNSHVFPNFLCCSLGDGQTFDTSCTVAACSNLDKLTYLCMKKLRPNGFEIPSACASSTLFDSSTDTGKCNNYTAVGAPFCDSATDWRTATCTNYNTGCGCDKGFFSIPGALFSFYDLDDDLFSLLSIDTEEITASELSEDNSVTLAGFSFSGRGSCENASRVDGVEKSCEVFVQNNDTGVRVQLEHWETCFDYLANVYAKEKDDFAIEDDSFRYELKPIVEDATHIPCCTLCCCQSRRWNQTVYYQLTDGENFEEIPSNIFSGSSTIRCSSKVCGQISQSDDSNTRLGVVTSTITLSRVDLTDESTVTAFRLYATNLRHTESVIAVNSAEPVAGTGTTVTVTFTLTNFQFNYPKGYWVVVPLVNGTTELGEEYQVLQLIKDAYLSEFVAVYPRHLSFDGAGNFFYYQDEAGAFHNLTAENGFLFGGAANHPDVYGFVNGTAGLCPSISCNNVFCTDDYVCPFIQCSAKKLSCPLFDTCSGGLNELGGGLADQTPLSFVVSTSTSSTGVRTFEVHKKKPLRTCSGNSTLPPGGTAQPFCDSLDMLSGTRRATLAELFELGLYWDDALVNPNLVANEFDVLPNPLHNPAARSLDEDVYGNYLSKMLDLDDESHWQKQDDVPEVVDNGGSGVFDCGPSHEACQNRPYSFCNTSISPYQCDCLPGFGKYENGCTDVDPDPDCGDHPALACAVVKFFLNQPECIINEADEIDLDCARNNMTVFQCMQSNFPYRFRNYDQFTPTTDTLNPNTVYFLRGAPFVSQGQGWDMSFQATYPVSSGTLECECADQGMRCLCTTPKNGSFVFQPALTSDLNQTETTTPTFQALPDLGPNHIEDDVEGATPIRGPTLSRIGWTEVAALSCSKCLSIQNNFVKGNLPEVLSSVCSEKFLSVCHNLEGRLRWPICSYCALDQVGSSRNTSNINSEVTHYNRLQIQTTYQKFAVNPFDYPSPPATNAYDEGVDFKTQKVKFQENQLLAARDATLQRHVTTMLYAAELAAQQNRWAGYNFTRGGYNSKQRHGNIGAYEDVELTSVARTFCSMIDAKYADVSQTTDQACGICETPYSTRNGDQLEYSNDIRWGCRFCVNYAKGQENQVTANPDCITYKNLHTSTVYEELRTELGFSDLTTLNDNKLLRLESDIVGFWRWCESDDHLIHLYNRRDATTGYFANTENPWAFTSPDACEQARFSFNPIPIFGTKYYESNPRRPISYKKWWSSHDSQNPGLTSNPATWDGWVDGSDQQTLEVASDDYNQIFWGLTQGLAPDLAQQMPLEDFANTESLFDIDLQWYGFPHNPWRCLEYSDLKVATQAEFERNRRFEDAYTKSPADFVDEYVYWCGVCNSEIYCPGKSCCKGGLSNGEPYGFADYCNPYVYKSNEAGVYEWKNDATGAQLVELGRSLCPVSTPLRTDKGFADLVETCAGKSSSITDVYQEFAKRREDQPTPYDCSQGKK